MVKIQHRLDLIMKVIWNPYKLAKFRVLGT